MNFEKWLRLLMEKTLPEWREHYLSYRLLKRRIKLIEASMNNAPNCTQEGASCPDVNRTRGIPEPILTKNVAESRCNLGKESLYFSSSSSNGGVFVSQNEADDVSRLYVVPLNGLTENEVGFINLLNAELEKLNKFVEEKIKNYDIRLQILKDRIGKIKIGYGAHINTTSEREFNEEVIAVGKDLVNFHGELVLLENYSVWNYTGLRKILKKYDRRIRAVLGERYVHLVKYQPCFATGTLSKLLTECHSIVQSLPFSSFIGDKMTAAITEIFCNENEQMIYRSSIAALEILSEMMKVSSAYEDDS